MNRQYVLLLLGLALLFSKSSYSQLSVSEITSSSAKVSFPNPNNDTKTIILESRTPEDTIIFKEDFSNIPLVPIGEMIAGRVVPSTLPNMYTEYPGCQAQNIASKFDRPEIPSNVRCYLSKPSTSSYPSCFITSIIDLSMSDKFNLEFVNHYVQGSISTNLYISILDKHGTYQPIDTITTPMDDQDFNNYNFEFDKSNSTLSSLEIDYSKTRIKFQLNGGNLTTTTTIDDIKILYPESTIVRKSFDISDYIEINNLIPSRTYSVYLENDENSIINFTTNNELYINPVADYSPYNAEINYISTKINTKLVINQISKNNTYNDSTIFADDLFISKYICAGTATNNKGVEIYNGTGRDICLEDYTIQTHFNGNSLHIMSFTDKDTIYSGEAFLYSYLRTNSPNIQNTKTFVSINPNHTAVSLLINGNDAIALFKNNDTIDVFGDLINPPATCWEEHNKKFKTDKAIIKRKPSIRKGSPTNKNTSIGLVANKVSTFLRDEWDLIYSGNSPTTDDLSTVGTHVMTGAMNIPIDTNEMEELIDKSTNLGNEKYAYLLEELEEDTFYEIYLAADTGSSGNTGTIESNRMRFRTGKVTERNSNTGNWNDGDWTKGVPTERDYAVIGSTDKLTIPENEIARAKRVILKTDDNHNRAELRNYGEMEIDEFEIKVRLEGHGGEDNLGWYLLGMPVNIDTENNPEQTINNLEDSLGIGGNDDLYYWQAEYSDDNNNEGRWVNYKSIPPETGDFFTNERGYLISYENDKTINFSGQIKNEDSYNLLDNITFESNASNWYLFHNPYPFTISYSNIDKTKVSNPNLLDYNSLNYTPLNPWDVNTYKIPPYTGFFVQVNVSGDNELVITKEENNNSAKSNDVLINYFNMDISSSSGYDKTKVVIIEGGSDEYNYVYDNRKLNGLGMSPEISSLINNESYAIKTIADFEDSLWIDLNVVIKQPGINDIGLEIMDTANLEEIVLIDKTDYSLLFDFLQDSIYSQSYSVGEYDNLRLLIKKRKTNTLEDIANNSDIIIVQEGNRAVVTSSNKINSLELINMKGQIINMNKNKNSIIIPEKGVFILKVITSEKEYNKKLINL